MNDKKIKFTAAKKAEIEAAVAAGEIKVHPQIHEDTEETVKAMTTNENAKISKKTTKTTKKSTKEVVSDSGSRDSAAMKPIKLGESIKVDSVSTGTLVLKMDLLSGLELKSGDQVMVDGSARTISNVTKYAKKNQVSIATSGFGKWPLGNIEVQFKQA